MFKKSFNQKTSSTIRSSDRKKLRNRVATLYFDEDADRASALVPEGLRSARFATHLDVPGTLYTSASAQPLWFSVEIDSGHAIEMVPTGEATFSPLKPIFVFDKFLNSFLPILSTPPPAIAKILGGADLMIPGIVEAHVEGSMPTIAKGAMVAVSSSANPQVPLAVGQMLVSSGEITADGKGKAVAVYHGWKDHLWEEGDKSPPPDSIASTSIEEEPVVEPGNEQELSVSDAQDTNVLLQSVESDLQNASLGNHRHIPSSQEVDEIIRSAFCQCLYSWSRSKSPPRLPMSGNSFYSTHLLPSRQLLPEDNETVPASELLKRSSFKSLNKLLQSFEKEGLIRTKAYSKGGEVHIVAVDLQNPLVQGHEGFRTIGDAEAKEAKKAAETQRKADAENQPGLEIREIWRVPQNLKHSDIFSSHPSALIDGLSPADMKQIMEEYVGKHDSIHPSDRRKIVLDDTLRSALAAKKGELIEVQTIGREELAPRLKAALQPWHSISPRGGEPFFRKGALPSIEVTVKKRMGNKVGTTISHFEPYLLVPEFLSDELRKSCASATSISALQGSKGGSEVFVQGSHLKIVTDLLLNQGVPKNRIDANDTTATKKKK